MHADSMFDQKTEDEVGFSTMLIRAETPATVVRAINKVKPRSILAIDGLTLSAAAFSETGHALTGKIRGSSSGVRIAITIPAFQ
jgi:hypothetical protein